LDVVEILLPALGAGTVAVLVTLVIERFGGTLGGILGTLPTTIVPAAIGIYRASSSEDAFVHAMAATPPGMLLNALFLYLWRVLPPKLPAWGLLARLAAMSLAGLSAWLCAAVVVVIGMRSLPGERVFAVGIAGFVAIVVVGVLACLAPIPAPKGSRRVTPTTLVLRGVFAAVAIGVAVVLAKTGGPLAAGVAAVFPAIFLTTMVSLWLSQGESVQAGAVGPMMLGSSSVAAFALGAVFAFPALGVVLGTVVTWLATLVCVALPAYAWLRRRRQSSARRASSG
jgi:hypothetical protein